MSKKTMLGMSSESLHQEGLKEQPQSWEDGLRAETRPGAFEWWYFDANFDDGSSVVVIYFTKPLLER